MESEYELTDIEMSEGVLGAFDASVDESFEAVVRLLDTHEALTHLIESHSTLSTEVYATKAKLLYGMAIRGTDISLESIDYSPEATTRSLSEIAKAIIRAISEFFKRILDWMTEIDITTNILRRKAYMLQRAALAARGRMISQPYVTLNRLNRFLRSGRTYLHDGIRLERELKILLNVCKVSFVDLPQGVLKALDRLPTVARADDKKMACIDVVESIPFNGLAAKMNMSPLPVERFRREGVLTSGPLIGGKSVFLFRSDLREKGTVGLRFHGFMYTDTQSEQFNYEAQRDFDTMGPLDVVKLPDLLIEILGTVSRVANSSTISQVKRAKSVAENFSMRVATDATMSVSDRDYIRKTVNALMYWSTNISRPLGNDAISVCKAVMHYCQSSLKAQR